MCLDRCVEREKSERISFSSLISQLFGVEILDDLGDVVELVMNKFSPIIGHDEGQDQARSFEVLRGSRYLGLGDWIMHRRLHIEFFK